MKASTVLLETKAKKISGLRHDIIDGEHMYCAIGILEQKTESELGDYVHDENIKSFFNLPDMIKCPECGANGSIFEIIAHLNNDEDGGNLFEKKHGAHTKSFKEIGEWLQSIGL